MQPGTMLWILLLLMFSLSVAAPMHASLGCTSSHYKDNNGSCQLCPKQCRSCVSNISCTVCEDNHWGLTCHLECGQQCSYRCHKEFGLCTYGCPDGTFVQPNSAECLFCAPNCEVCSSASDCLRCNPRFYGPDCQSCSHACVDNRCNMTTGECYACTDGYFSDDGNCQKCPSECSSCNDAGNCTRCDKSFYGPYNGTCFLECRNTATARQFLGNAEDRCDIPNGLMSHDTQLCENVHRNQSYTCSTKRYCLMDKTCSSENSCLLNQDDDNNASICLRIMSEICFAKCRPSQTAYREDVNYLCSQSCTVEHVDGESYGPVCFHVNKTPDVLTVGYPLTTVYVLCFSESDTYNDVTPLWDRWNVFLSLITVSSIGLIVTCIGGIVLMFRYKLRKSSTRAAKHSTQIDIEHVTTDLETGGIPRINRPALQRDAHTPIGMTEGMPTPRRQPQTRCEEKIAETDIIPLRQLATVQHKERTNTSDSAGMTSLVNQQSDAREKYLALGVNVEVHNYDNLEIRDIYDGCEVIRTPSLSGVNSRSASGTSSDYMYISPT